MKHILLVIVALTFGNDALGDKEFGITRLGDLPQTPEEALTRHPPAKEVRELTEQWHEAYVGGQVTPEYLETLGSDLASHGDTMQTSWVGLVLKLDIEAGGTDMWRHAMRGRGLPRVSRTNALTAAAYYYDLSKPDSDATKVASGVLALIEGSPDHPNLDDHEYFLTRYKLSSPSLIIRMMRLNRDETLALTDHQIGLSEQERDAMAEEAVQLLELEARQMHGLVGSRSSTEASREALTRMADGPHWIVRLYALHAMADNPGLWDKALFERLLADEEELVQRETRFVIERIGRDRNVPDLTPDAPEETPAADEEDDINRADLPEMKEIKPE